MKAKQLECDVHRNDSIASNVDCKEPSVDKKDHPFKNNRSMPLTLRVFFAVMTQVFKVLDKVAPAFAGKLALRLFMTPPKHSMPEREVLASESATLKFYTLRGRDIAVRSWGEGPTVLLSHGWGGRTTQLYALIQPLVDAGYRVLGADIAAHGDSSGKQSNMLDAAMILSEVVEKEGLAAGDLKAIIGHSFGTGVALLAMDRWHLAPQKLVLISPFSDVHWVTRTFAEVFSMSEKIIVAMEQRALTDLATQCEGTWDWDHISPVHTIKSATSDILLIHDKEDHEVPYEHVEKLHKQAPQASLFSTSGYGHRRILRNKETIEEVVSFIRKL